MTNKPGLQSENKVVPGDPWKVHHYRLSNGLRLFVSPRHDEPRIHTNIAFRAGSKHDPPDTTGLAHYMEHMLFKGTSRIGALDWPREQKYLQRIADLYEVYRHTTAPEERRRLYREIDQLSFEAAKLVAPSEYDRLVGALGAKATNAYTWVEQTVYVNDIPANELDRWMQLEGERFRHLALRLFHTELETVYEEFNISQDQDFRKVNNALRRILFPRHPYGTQTTLGHPEHLRNPSIKNIQAFFERYYVPGNMAIVLSGDVVPEAALELAERHFGMLAPREVPPFEHDPQPPLSAPVREDVVGKEAPYLMLGWRCGSASTDAPLYLTLLERILSNGQAGLIDVNLNQTQRLLHAQAWHWTYEDYSVFGLMGRPREGQSLEEVERLLLDQLGLVREGDFSERLLEAILNNIKLEDIQDGESNGARVSAITQMFILGVDWQRFVQRLSWMEHLGKERLVAWVRQQIRPDNFAVVYKRQGEDRNAIKVEKPPITPVQLKRGTTSMFGEAFLATRPARLRPRFADFKEDVQQRYLLPGLRLDYVHNPNNALFRLDYLFDMGKATDRHFPLALLYLPYLGTDRYSPQALQEAFFRLGLRYDVYTSNHRSFVTLRGLDEHLEAGMELLDHLLQHAQAKQSSLRNFLEDILTRREHAKKDRKTILHSAMLQYGLYGRNAPFSYRLSREELLGVQAETLTDWIHRLREYPHQVSYFGPRSLEETEAIIAKHHSVPSTFREKPEQHLFSQIETQPGYVYVVDFPIVQSDLLMLSRGTPHFDLEQHCLSQWYNSYFGLGLSSVIFQEIRESKALAYSTFARFNSPVRRDESHFLQAYIGTQPDKLVDALPALRALLDDMPVEPSQMHHARQSILRRLETETTVPRKLYWRARLAWDRGYEHDLRRDLYHRIKRATAGDLVDFQRQQVRQRPMSLFILGQKKRLDLDWLASLGEVVDLPMEDIFGY